MQDRGASRSARWWWVLGGLGLALSLALGLAWWGRWTIVDAVVRARHPEVRAVDAATLAAWLSAPSPPRLLDARTTAEHALSRIEGAERVDPELRDLERVTLAGDARVVVYCSIGWRSGDVAAALARAGRGDVYNLEGGLFAWANAGHPVVGPGAPRVHPYDAAWGRLLDPARRAPIE